MSTSARVWPPQVSEKLLEVVERVCTDAEKDALALRFLGFGPARSAQRLGVAPGAVRQLWRSAEGKVRAEVAAMRGVV